MKHLRIMVVEDYLELYNTGFMDLVWHDLVEQGSFEAYEEYLKGAPVSYFVLDGVWTLQRDAEGNNTLHEVDVDGEERDYKVTAVVELDGELIIHSHYAHNSFLFKVPSGSDVYDVPLRGIYVD